MGILGVKIWRKTFASENDFSSLYFFYVAVQRPNCYNLWLGLLAIIF